MTILQLRRFQKKDADLDAVAASGVASAWTAYTPTVTAGSGTFTTVSATGRYLLIGKLVMVEMVITITTNGTASFYMTASLPFTAAARAVLVGREVAVAGFMAVADVAASTSTALLVKYDGTYPGGSGYMLDFSGSYERT